MRRGYSKLTIRRAPHVALLLSLSATGGCFLAPPPPAGPRVDPELAQSTAGARLSLRRGATAEAAILYRRALNRARAMDDAAGIGDAGYNLGACLLRAGRYDEARAALREAEAETIRAAGPSGAGADAADVLLLEARVARLAGKPAEAIAFADRVTRERASHPGPAERVQADVLRGEIACDAADASGAAGELARARRDSGGLASPAVLAAVDGLDARLWWLRGDAGRAAPLFDRQAEQLRQAGLFRDMARALARAGRAWTGAKSPAPAADRLFRAGRALAAQGEPAEAGRLLAEAAAAARESSDAPLRERIEALREDPGPPTRPGD